jgi:serine/threonine protein phosphatase PrpC
MRVRSQLELAFGSVRGPVRASNEDEFLVYEPAERAELESLGRLLIVADGVGGGPAGAEASHVALRHFLAGFLTAEGGASLRLAHGVQAANAALVAEVRRRPNLEGMATTLTAISVRGRKLEGVQLGDTACLLGREGQWRPLSPMHRATSNSKITRAIGAGGERARPEPFDAELRAGDLLLLATDGVWDGLGEERVFALLRGVPAHVGVERLLEAAQRSPGGDNATAVLMRVPGPEVDHSLQFREVEEISPPPPLPDTPAALGPGQLSRLWPWLLLLLGTTLLLLRIFTEP